MIFIIPLLPYASDALEPAISKQTIDYHYGKHLQTYINNLNGLISGTPFESMTLEEIIKKSDGAIFNNAAQTWNHIFYFSSFKPGGCEEPSGHLVEQINKTWGSLEEFKKEFSAAAISLFGSGWVWLAKDINGKLSIVKEANAGNPITKELTPILGFDVWEHAYYLDYQNRRADHITALWNIIDWEIVSGRY